MSDHATNAPPKCTTAAIIGRALRAYAVHFPINVLVGALLALPGLFVYVLGLSVAHTRSRWIFALFVVAMLGGLGRTLGAAIMPRVIGASIGVPAPPAESRTDAPVGVETMVTNLLFLAAITSVAAFLGFLVLLFPGFWIVVHFGLAPVVCVVEGRGVQESLKRSYALASRAPWTVFFVLFLVTVLTIVTGPVFLGWPSGNSVGEWLMFDGLQTMLVMPLFGILVTATYAALRADEQRSEEERIARTFDEPSPAS